jgi:hypothetical protein
MSLLPPDDPNLHPSIRPSGEILRKGKKSVSYTEDPEILARLSRVAGMLLKGFPAWKIADELKYPIGSAKRDIARVRAIWKKESRNKMTGQRDEALAQYRLAREKAWALVDKNPEKAERYLPIVLAAQERIDKLTGAEAPAQITLDGEVKVRNIEQVRQKRWAQIASEIRNAAEGQP